MEKDGEKRSESHNTQCFKFPWPSSILWKAITDVQGVLFTYFFSPNKHPLNNYCDPDAVVEGGVLEG